MNYVPAKVRFNPHYLFSFNRIGSERAIYAKKSTKIRQKGNKIGTDSRYGMHEDNENLKEGERNEES